MSIVTGILTGGANAHQTTSEEANAWATDFISEGIVGSVGSTNGIAPTTGSFSINAQGTPDMTVAVGSGTAYVTGTPSSQASQTFRVKNSATSNVTISANSSGSTKYDWVYIKLDATKLNTPNSAADDVATLVTSRSSSASSDDGTPPTYGYPLAVVTVANGATTITNSNIRDLRTQSTISSTTAGTSNDWYSLALSPNTVTALGNRSYSLVFNSTDLTSYISNGMRLKLPRTVTAPTQCADLESGSSQYFSKTSPMGLSFTTTFTCSAWIKLESYHNGGIIARRNADTEGWNFSVESTGQIILVGLRVASNNKVIRSYQSLPLNKWVHVAATLDMAAGDTTAQKIWIDGVEVPRAYILTGTATALVQGTTALTVGAEKSGGTFPFDGKIAQAAVFSAQLSDATIKAMANQTMTGAESGLVSAYTFNNSINDLSANANNLTANGGALATTVDSPMNATEYGIVMANSFSTNTTLTVQVPEGYSLPTTGGIGTVSYSTQKTPYGWPRKPFLKTEVILQAAFNSTATPTVTDISGLTISYTAAGTETIRLKLIPYYVVSSAGAGSFVQIYIRDVTTSIAVAGFTVPGSNYSQNPKIEIDINPTVGAHTYVASISQSAAGTMTFNGAAGSPAIFSLEVLEG